MTVHIVDLTTLYHFHVETFLNRCIDFEKLEREDDEISAIQFDGGGCNVIRVLFIYFFYYYVGGYL